MKSVSDKKTDVIKSLSDISSIWETLSEDSGEAPFHKDLIDLIHDIIEWRDSLGNE